MWSTYAGDHRLRDRAPGVDTPTVERSTTYQFSNRNNVQITLIVLPIDPCRVPMCRNRSAVEGRDEVMTRTRANRRNGSYRELSTVEAAVPEVTADAG